MVVFCIYLSFTLDPGLLDAERRSTNQVRMHIYGVVVCAALTRSIAAPSPSPSLPLLFPSRPASRSRGLLFTLACDCSAPGPLYVCILEGSLSRPPCLLFAMASGPSPGVRPFIQRLTLNVERASSLTVHGSGARGSGDVGVSPQSAGRCFELLLAC
ncbi:hypothetical protein C8Q74DRAFT_1286552 [Fomes fomentarius]|nr:hypothetical protein C8Q74DRAFT_1286552 [Fomes fomentarius]